MARKYRSFAIFPDARKVPNQKATNNKLCPVTSLLLAEGQQRVTLEAEKKFVYSLCIPHF